MAEEMERYKLFFFVILIIVLMAGYLCLTLTKHETEAHRIGELLTIVVIAMVSYFLGYSQRQRRILSENTQYREKYSHITKKYISRLGYFFLAVGFTLIFSHAILFGIDLTFSELLTGHEWIGLYVVIVSMYMLGIAKKMN